MIKGAHAARRRMVSGYSMAMAKTPGPIWGMSLGGRLTRRMMGSRDGDSNAHATLQAKSSRAHAWVRGMMIANKS